MKFVSFAYGKLRMQLAFNFGSYLHKYQKYQCASFPVRLQSAIRLTDD